MLIYNTVPPSVNNKHQEYHNRSQGSNPFTIYPFRICLTIVQMRIPIASVPAVSSESMSTISVSTVPVSMSTVSTVASEAVTITEQMSTVSSEASTETEAPSEVRVGFRERHRCHHKERGQQQGEGVADSLEVQIWIFYILCMLFSTFYDK